MKRFILFFICVAMLTGCKDIAGLGSEEQYDLACDSSFVINEIMPSNRTGLLSEDGNLYDWIELRNTSSDSISIANMKLSVVKKENAKDKDEKVKKEKKDKKNKKEKKDKKDKEGKKDKAKVWTLPDMKIGPGDCLIIFASKKDQCTAGSELHSNFKLSSDGGKVQILTPADSVICEVEYPALEPDQSLQRCEDGTFKTTYEATPGFDNSREGYEQSCTRLDAQRKDPLRIWEVKSKGERSSMFVELKNVSSAAVNLRDYTLASKPDKADKYALPDEQLQPGGIYVVSCAKGAFKIGDAETVLLMKNGKMADGVCAVQTTRGVSIGRVEGKSGFFYFPSPTRGSVNGSTFKRYVAPRPEFTPAPGAYNDKKTMSITLDTHGHEVHYTLDGSVPSPASPVYRQPININTTTTIRTFAEGDSESLRSAVRTATYFLDDSITLAVVNVIVNESDLYDFNTGIYAEGPGGGGEWPYKNANYWKTWTKRAHIEYYDEKGSFEADCGIAIFGGFSRALAKKSFKIKFKDIYGPTHVTYDIYNEGEPVKWKNLVLRSGSQDITGVMVRDEFFTSLMKKESPTLLVQSYRPVSLYINGKYFGLYYIREKVDKHYVARHLNVSNDSISILFAKLYVDEGSSADYRDVLNYAQTHDLSKKEYYDHVCSRVDIEGLIDWKLGQMYASNTDIGNIRYVRSLDSAGDRKWHFVYYDLDATWVTNKPASFYLSRGGADSGAVTIHNVLIDCMLKNADFRKLFWQHVDHHMATTFSPKYATAVFDSLINTIAPEMRRNCARWPNLMSYGKWEDHVKHFRDRFQTRDSIMLKSIHDYLDNK